MNQVLQPYEGPVEGVLLGSDIEILRELMGVVEATRDKNIKLTKAGIPPKPLWTGVNDRLLWKDPMSILHDWDEVDQVRMIYGLAEQLLLIHPDPDRILEIGPGADPFFLAPPNRRGRLLLKAYLELDSWDERCDARNEHGHRQNFGQTFRRDFLLPPEEVRLALLRALAETPLSSWVTSEALARRVSFAEPALLLSEDDEVPEPEQGEMDPEVRRLVDYWLFLAARFGWVDLARIPEDAGTRAGGRLFRLTALGAHLLGLVPAGSDAGKAPCDPEATPFILQPNHEVILFRNEGDPGDEYLLSRLAVALKDPQWDEPVVTYALTAESVGMALDSGIDPDTVRSRLFARARTDVPRSVQLLLDDAIRNRGRVRLTSGLTALELTEDVETVADRMRAAGFEVIGGVVLVPWTRWHEVRDVLGEEPTEGFSYPPDEPLGRFEGNTLKLEWPVLPLMARDLLDALEVRGDPPEAEVDDFALARLASLGWPEKAVAEALAPLTDGHLPRRLRG